MSNVMLSVRKLSHSPNMTGSSICPNGRVFLLVTPQNGADGVSLRFLIYICQNTSGDSRLMSAPPSMRVRPTLMLQIVEVTMTLRRSTPVVLEG